MSVYLCTSTSPFFPPLLVLKDVNWLHPLSLEIGIRAGSEILYETCFVPRQEKSKREFHITDFVLKSCFGFKSSLANVVYMHMLNNML